MWSGPNWRCCADMRRTTTNQVRTADSTPHFRAIFFRNVRPFSGAGTNLKVGLGAHARREARDFFWLCPSTFLALQVQLVVFVSAFVMVSTVLSVCCLLFFYSRCAPYPVICKSGGSYCQCPMASAPVQYSCVVYFAVSAAYYVQKTHQDSNSL